MLAKQIFSQIAHDGTIWCCTWHPSGGIIATCGSDKLIHLWTVLRDQDRNIQTLVKSQTLDDIHTKSIRSIKFSSNGKFLASASFDATIGIWVLSEGKYKHIQTLEGHDNEVKCVAWSEDCRYLASCSRDKTIWIWDYDVDLEFQCVSVLSEHTQVEKKKKNQFLFKDVKYVLWIPGTRNLLSCGYDDTIRLWRQKDEDWECGEFDILQQHETTVWGLAIAKFSHLLASCSGDGVLKLWKSDEQIEEKQPFTVIQTIQNFSGNQPIYSCCFNYNGGLLATAQGDNSITILKISQMESDMVQIPHYDIVKSIEKHDQDVNCVEFSPLEENILISCGDDETLKIFEIDLQN